MRQKPILALAAMLVMTVGMATTASAAVSPSVPTGQLIVPAVNATWNPGQVITLTTNAQDTSVNPGYTAGVTDVEWWLYSDQSIGDTYTFATQYPGNTENKIYLGDTVLPSSGTKVNGTWKATFTVPTNGQMTVTRDGQSPGGLSAPRTYIIKPGVYSVQSHIQNAWWDANMGVETGKTAMTPINLNAGGITTPPPPPPPPSTNLVANPSIENGTTCFQSAGWGNGVYTAGTTTAAHTGGVALSLKISSISSGDHKWLVQQANCAPAVTAGLSYTASVWVKSTSTHNTLTVFKLTSAGWSYWTDLKTVGASSSYTQLSAATPVVPAGVTRIAVGVASPTIGTILTDDYSLVAR